ncbi:DUF6193 family natural product biosynthesis protein [Streptomyces justiciae]|uniref:DUF6193 family natural product biosynthesis protein n=1 Tax=Streptomyces justiciae TaxID=2780140 RepID=UPI0021193D3C|nr:DUF6193 family natural product biosynthesis protein [Streptomyces justiciae]MCW8377834.1 DUF6193 family natural product biosynthesis protein [Streptomyces justiciae]
MDRDAAVAAGWEKARADGRVRDELLDLAHAEPRLRDRYPWIGMGELHFSRTTEYPWTWDARFVLSEYGGTYFVMGPSRQDVVGRVETAREAIDLVLETLPDE